MATPVEAVGGLPDELPEPPVEEPLVEEPLVELPEPLVEVPPEPLVELPADPPFVELLAVVLELVEVLLLDPTLTGAEPVMGAMIGGRRVGFDAGVVLDAGAVLCVVLATTAVWVVSAVLGAPVSDVRSITPTLGVTTVGVSSATVATASALLDPDSEPQAARPNVSRLHSTTLRMCERAAEEIFFIDHYPG
jgi:hypothetical protein